MDIKNIIKSIYNFLWQIYSKVYSPIVIKKYISSNKIFKLHVGSGQNIMNNWLNCDIGPLSKDVIFTDVSKRFPFDDNFFDYIYSEHMIEHITFEEGLFMLKECFRILKPGGRIRITTPDLNTLIDILKNHESKYDDYIEWSFKYNSLVGKNSDEVFNNFMHNWGHKFIYTKNFLKINMEKIGFKNFEFFKVLESKDENLKNLENTSRLPENFLQIESFTIEGVK